MRIRARLDEMGERLVVAEDAADRPGTRSRRRRAKPASSAALAGAEQRELPALVDEPRQRVQQQVEALLLGQAADHAEQRAVRRRSPGRAALCSAALLRARMSIRIGVEGLRQSRIGRRVPDRRRRCR